MSLIIKKGLSKHHRTPEGQKQKTDFFFFNLRKYKLLDE